MNREVHVRIWERPEVRVLRATRHQWKAPLDGWRLVLKTRVTAKVMGSIPPPSANPERASRQAHCDRLLTGSSPRVSVSNTGRSANPILSMAGNVFGKDATVVRSEQGAPVIGGSISRGARQVGCNPAARSGALFDSAFPTIASVIQRHDSRPISGQWSVQFRPLVPITGA